LFTLFKKLFRHTGRTLKNFPPWWQYYFSFLRGVCTIEICFYSVCFLEFVTSQKDFVICDILKGYCKF
jgi:hypothetical protein